MYDLIIIGLGPAGLTAGIYAARYKINTLLVGEKPGGQATDAYIIENYPGIPDIPGVELLARFKKHLEKFKLPIKQEIVKGIKKINSAFEVVTEKNKYQTKTVIFASGTERRKLQIPGEKELLGKGVGFCATCDAFFFREKTTAVVGGADSAVTAALQLAEVGKKVYLVFRTDKLTAIPAWVERVKENPKIELIPKSNVLKIKGENKVESIELDKPHQDKKELKVDGVFIEIGAEPISNLIKPLGVKTDQKGYIKVNEAQETNIAGLFAAGDATTGSNKLQQIVTAAAEGAIAASSVFKYLKKN